MPWPSAGTAGSRRILLPSGSRLSGLRTGCCGAPGTLEDACTAGGAAAWAPSAIASTPPATRRA
eukprot:6111359-Alexandrium_andersonii.AAC.1